MEELCDDDYCLGSAMLCAPVLNEGKRGCCFLCSGFSHLNLPERLVKLPPSSDWFFIPTMQRCSGTVAIEAPLGRALFFLRCGTAVPFDPQFWTDKQQIESNGLCLMAFPSGGGDERIVYDDSTVIQCEEKEIFCTGNADLLALPCSERRAVVGGVELGEFHLLRFVQIQKS